MFLYVYTHPFHVVYIMAGQYYVLREALSIVSYSRYLLGNCDGCQLMYILVLYIFFSLSGWVMTCALA